MEKMVSPLRFTLAVNYGEPVEALAARGKYDRENGNIISTNFPTKQKGAAKVAVELVNFNRSIPTKEAFVELDEREFRPAELHELLALGIEQPDLQRQFPIVAIGSCWRDLDGRRRVPCLHGDGNGRDLDLFHSEGAWNERYRFLAVRT